jgi:geranylgeranyl pyrophosphate synthase
MVFQLTDDVLDLVATEEFLGKPAGSDIGEGTYTLPVLLALEGPSGDRLRRLLAAGKPHRPEAVAQVLEVVRSEGHVDRALAEVDARMAAAGRALDELGDGEVVGVFRSLGGYLLERVATAVGR